MKIKKGDNVIILAGKDKGKKGKVVNALIKIDRVVIEGINMKKKHVKATRAGAKGEVIEIAAPLHVSNVALEDPKSKKATRVGYKKVNGKNVRIAKASGAEV